MRCDQCEPYKYGFSSEGCKSCECDRIGSKGLQCDASGQCPCLDNVEGRKCDRCKENKHDRQKGCIDCPDCYNLVQDEVRRHDSKLEHLRDILDEIERNPTVVDDQEFENQLQILQEDVEDHYQLAKDGTGGDEKTITQKLDNIRERQKDISETILSMDEKINVAKDKGECGKSSSVFRY